MTTISVVVATRGRVQQLGRMLDSFVCHAEDVTRVEIVLRVDYDDHETIEYLRFRQFPFIVGSRLNGYATLATLVNEAARLSHGDLVLVVNDDAECVTQGWDKKLLTAAANFSDGIFDLGIETENAANFIFPCVSRRVIDILGVVFDERLVYTDIWLRDVMATFGRAVRVPEVEIKHHWEGMTEDQVRAVQNLNGPEYQALYGGCVREAAEKIQKAMSW